MLVDAHLHWQDPRLERCLPDLRQILTTASVGMAVVNGTSEEDWAKVHGLGKQSDRILCSYGLHPWYIHERSQRWLENLGHWLKQDGTPVGEIGLDRWLRKDNLEEQVEVFLAQWSLANEHKRAVTVHCLKAWGRLLELVESHPHEGPGFLLHSYGGPVEMVPEFLNLGAYFSFSGGFMHPRKSRQLEVLKTIPMERLLLETDAPEMLPPSDWCFCPLSDSESGKAINHPGNIRAIYEFVSSEWGISHQKLQEQLGCNARSLFAPSCQL